MKIWLVLLLGGILTYLTRASFIFLFGVWNIPSWAKRLLKYVPPAILSALIVPELFMQSGKVLISLGNVRLLAGIVATLTAILTKNTLWTILSGIACMAIFNMLL